MAIKIWVVGCLAVVASLVLPPMTGAEGPPGAAWDCPEQSEQRPYVCDIGPAKALSMPSFRQLVRTDSAIRATVARIGLPDAVEIQRVLVNAPWEDHEVRAYYRAYNRVFVFGRAFILGEPEVALLRHEGPIPADWLASRRPVDVGARVRNAEAAALQAEAKAERAEQLAERAEAIADSLAADFPRRLMKN